MSCQCVELRFKGKSGLKKWKTLQEQGIEGHSLGQSHSDNGLNHDCRGCIGVSSHCFGAFHAYESNSDGCA